MHTNCSHFKAGYKKSNYESYTMFNYYSVFQMDYFAHANRTHDCVDQGHR